MPSIGIFGVSTKSGKAYLADLASMDVEVYGYARPTDHGRAVVSAVTEQGGVYLKRPESTTEPPSRFVPIDPGRIGHDIEALIDRSEAIIIAHPSIYHEETAEKLTAAGVTSRGRPTLILAPSRTLATPYLWRILGDQYPILSFLTCPYSCKSYAPGQTYIKRRKKSWVASVEGDVPADTLAALEQIFPQMLVSHVPATTSLGNIGAVFHPSPYLLNLDAIRTAEAAGRDFSFYVDGIINNPDAARVIGEIDQIRLSIARAIGCSVFGLAAEPMEQQWNEIMQTVRTMSQPSPENIRDIRRQLAVRLAPLKDLVVSGQHWLDYTYGTRRIPGESLSHAIGRTSTFLMRSYAQDRYIHEDVPTGLVPFEALAKRLGIPHEPITRMIDSYRDVTGTDARESGRNLEPFETDYLKSFLSGRPGEGRSST